MTSGPSNHTWKSVVPYFGANILFGAGLWTHAFLYNFYVQALGYEESVMGFAAAALTGGGIVALLPAGLVVDHVGSRRAFMGAVALASLGLLLGAFAEPLWAIYGAAFIAGMGAAAWRVTMGPVLMEITDGGFRARAFSWNVALLLASGAGWTALAGGMTEWLEVSRSLGELGGLRWTLAGSAVLTAVAGPVFLAVGLREQTAADRERPSWLRAVEGLVLPRRLVVFVGVVALWMTAGGLVLPFFNVFFQREYELSVGNIGTLFAAVQIATAVVLLGAGELSGRLGPRRALVGWSMVFAPALALLVLGGPLAMAIGLFALAGVVPPATNPLIDQVLLEEADPAEHGAVSSWRNGATEVSGFVGAGLGGALLEAWGFGGLFVSAALTAALGALALLLWLRSARA